MDGPVSWVVQLAVKPGRLEAFRAVMEEMVEASRTDPGTLIYEWFVNDAGTVVHIYERYADSAAAISHSTNVFAVLGERFMAESETTGFTVMGSPNDEALATLGITSSDYLKPLGGFARQFKPS